MGVFVGLDVSLASTAICVLGEKGKIVTEAQVASTPESLVAFMRKLPHGIAAIGLEAGPLSHWLHKGLSDAGFETVLMETRCRQAISSSDRKRVLSSVFPLPLCWDSARSSRSATRSGS